MEGVQRAGAVSRGVGQRIDDLQLLDGRARPAVGDDERHRIFMSRPDVNEVDIQPVDLGDELGMSVQLRLAPPPVVIGRPIPRERLNKGELHALRRIGDGFLLRESCRRDAPAHFVEFRFWSLEAKWANRGLVSSLLGASFGHSGWCHADVLLRAHETRCATCDLSGEGIGDTFVLVLRRGHTLPNRVRTLV